MTSRAASGDAESAEVGEAFEGRRPPFLDTRTLADLALPLLVVALAWAVRIRERDHDAVDPATLILTILALVAAVQALAGLLRLGRRLSLVVRAKRHRLVLEKDALIFESPSERIVVPRRRILGARAQGHWGERGGRAVSPVYVVTDPRIGRTHIVLPPVFGDGPGMIAETLMRWRGRDADEASAPADTPARLASRIYDDAASGKSVTEEGSIAVRHGKGWLARGPYVTALLGVALLLRWLAFDEQTAWLIGPEMVVIVLSGTLMVPIVWILLTLRELRPRKGLAFVITPDELLIRTRRGVLRTALDELGAPKIEEKRAWSAILGVHVERTLVLRRTDESPIRYEEAFMSIPVEVAAILLDAKKRESVNRGAAKEPPAAP